MSESIHPKLSVIIPVYNVEEFLHECLDSVLNQTFKNYEIILVNDGSTDSSGEICDYYQSKFKQVRTFHQANKGSSSARNFGIENAYGEYIIFLDSDDYWENDTFLEKVFESNPLSDLILFGMKKYNQRKLVIETYSKSIKRLSNNDSLNIYKLLINKIYISSACNKFIKLDYIKAKKIRFREVINSEDIEFSGIFIHTGFTFKYVNRNDYIYRQREFSKTNSISDKSIIDLRNNISDLIQNYPIESAFNKKNYKSYLGFQIGVYAMNIVGSDQFKFMDNLKFLRRNKYLMKHSSDNRIKLFYILTKIVGTNNSLRLLRKIV